MKNIATKSILAKKSARDGLRICVMRRIKPEYEFDMWLPAIAPSEQLLTDYVIEKKIGWDEFSTAFRKHILTKRKKYLVLLSDMAKKQKITLLCGEKSARYCHRRVLIEECEKLNKPSKKTLK